MFQTFSVQKQTESCISNTMTTAEVHLMTPNARRHFAILRLFKPPCGSVHLKPDTKITNMALSKPQKTLT